MSEILKSSFLLNPIEQNPKFRILDNRRLLLLNIWLIILIGFHFYVVIFGQLPNIQQGAVHLGFVLPAVFWVYSFNSKTREPNLFLEFGFHIVPAVASFICNFYIVFNFRQIAQRGGIPTPLEYVLGILLFVLIFEAGRRVVGNLTVVAMVFLFYTRYGYLFPGFLKKPPVSILRIIQHFYLTAEGIYGIAIYVASTFVVLFVVFGSFIAVGGAAEFFMDLGFALAGKQSGGPAKVAIITSGLLGMINGSSIANVATTGTFTIPLMKKLGYKPEFAAGVEAVASTGGQILPPIMGAAAFIMAQFLGISYARVMLAAVVPALLYYFSLYVNVHLEAQKLGLRGMSSDEIPKTIDVLKKRGYFIIPIIVIIGLLIKNFSAVYAAFGGIVTIVVISFVGRKENHLTPNKIFIAMRDGGKDMLGISMACSLVGFVIGTSSITGLGLVLANNILGLAKGNIPLTLILAMLSCLVLGMALPTTANYVVTSTIMAPALFKLGIPLLVSHLFCFQYGVTADITPPVCMATYTGAGIANANINKSGIIGVKLGLAAFLIPLVFVRYPILLMIDFKILSFIIVLTKVVIALVSTNIALENYFLTRINNIPLRAILLASSFTILFMNDYFSLLGVLAVFIVIIFQVKRFKTQV